MHGNRAHRADVEQILGTLQTFSMSHSADLSSWWGNCGKESRDSFPQFPYRLLAFSTHTYTGKEIHHHVSDRGLTYIENIQL